MENFRRSLKYLWPYRKRLILACLCVVAITVLWGGGLGMLGPSSKILISDEGLHGWAYDSVTKDRLDLNISRQLAPPGVTLNSREVTFALNVTEAYKDGIAKEAGIGNGDWIVGIYGDGTDKEILRADELSKLIAQSPEDETLALRIYNPISHKDSRVQLRLGKADWSSQLAADIVSKIPEPKTTADKYRIFLWALLIVLGINYLRDVFRFFQEYLVTTSVYRGMMDLRCDVYDTALRLPLTFFSASGTSDTTSRFIQDSGELSRGQVTLFGKTLVEPGKAIGALAMALIFSWKLTLIAMISGPPSYWLIRRFGKRMKKASKRALEGWSSVLAVLSETLRGVRVVKAYTMENAERKRFFRANRGLFRQQRKMAKIDSAVSPTIEALGITAACGVTALAGYWVIGGDMSPSDFIVMMACLAALFDPVRKLSKVVTRFQRSESAAARLFELHDREKEKTIPGAPMLPKHSESIEFRNVSFRYPGANVDAVKNINLTIKSGQTVAIVGPNGSGKTTLVSLLPRLLDASSGEIVIDGQNISKVSLRSLRRQIGLVTQDTVLFNATIGENIAYGLRRPKLEDVMDAAKKAFVDEFVRDLPEAYDTMVGEHGATLSGGQKQRITIARAILRDPAILIFDEATSQIDANSEHRIHQAMEEFVKDRTTLMIAHRFATVLSADVIVVMDDGQIVDAGTHEELLERCELYHHLYRTQFVDSGG